MVLTSRPISSDAGRAEREGQFIFGEGGFVDADLNNIRDLLAVSGVDRLVIAGVDLIEGLGSFAFTMAGGAVCLIQIH